MSIIRCSVITTTIVSASAYAGDWPAFRGPGATGIGEASALVSASLPSGGELARSALALAVRLM